MKGAHIGEFEELVLLAVQRLGDEAYGVSIKQLLERETTRAVSIGAVYASLDRLEGKGLVESRMTPGGAARGARQRRSFLASAAGLRALKEMRRVRDRLWHGGPARALTGRS
jgi:PadR family transcriptional regulator, regulatory protein PadR